MYKIKRFSFFGMDIFDFFDLIKDIKFQNKSTDLIDNSKDWDSTYYIIDSLSSAQSKNIKSILKNNLEPEIEKVLKSNSSFGSSPSPKDLELYVIYLEKEGNKTVLCFGLEAKKNLGMLKKGNCFSFSIPL